MVLEAERRPELADAVADDAHANLAVGDGLPAFGACVRLRLLEALNHLLRRAAGLRRRQDGGAQADGMQEGAPGE